MNDTTSRLGVTLGAVEQKLNACDTTRSFLRQCRAFRDQILEEEQLNNTYATWLDLTLQRRGLRPSDNQWQRLRDIATRPAENTEEARRTRALATLSGYISWEKTRHYNFHLASRPLLEAAVALTRKTSFDWTAFANRINCAMLKTHLKAIENAQSRQIAIIDGRPFRYADIKAAVHTTATLDMLTIVNKWAECSDGHLWQESGECLARRPLVRKYLLQYDAYGILVPRTGVEQIQLCDVCHHSPMSPATGSDFVQATRVEQRNPSLCSADHDSPPQVERPSAGGKGPKLTIAHAPHSQLPISPAPSITEHEGESQSSLSDPEEENSNADEQTPDFDTEMPCVEGHNLDIDAEMPDVLENSHARSQSSLTPYRLLSDADLQAWSQSTLLPYSPSGDQSEQHAHAFCLAQPRFSPSPILISPSTLQLIPASRNSRYPRPPIDSALDVAHALALEQCMVQSLGPSMSAWVDELRLASVYSDPGRPDTVTTAQYTADIWVMDEQAFCRFAHDNSFDRPILIKEKFKDAGEFSLDRCVREIRDRLDGAELSVRNPFTNAEEQISCATFVQELKQTKRAYSAQYLPPWADASKPRLTTLPRYRLLNTLVERLEAQRRPGESIKSELRDADSYRRHDTISVRGAYSSARIDALTGSWTRNLLGKTIWMFVPRTAMTTEDWNRFIKEDTQWNPKGKARAVILDVGDVLFIPPGFHIIYSVLTLETSWMEGGIVWDEWGIAPLLKSLRWAASNRSTREHPGTCFLDGVLSALDEIVTADPGRFARGEDEMDFLIDIKVKALEIVTPVESVLSREVDRWYEWVVQ